VRDPEPDLVEAVAGLDEAACSELVRRYEGLVRVAVRQGGYFFEDARDEEETQSQLRLEMLRSIRKWDRRKGAFSTWVYAIARNLINSSLRDRQRRVVSGRSGSEVALTDLGASFDPPDPTTEETEEDAQTPPLVDAFLRLCDGMSDDDRVVIDHMVRRAPHRELATELKCSEDAAKMRVYRMRERIRQALRGEVDRDRT